MKSFMAATTSDSKQSLLHLPRRWFPGKEQRPENQPGSGSTSRGEKPKRLGFWLRLLLLMFLVNLFFYGPLLPALFQGQPSTVDLPYTSFVQQVEQGNVTSVMMSGNVLSGAFKTPLREQQMGSGRGALVASHFTTYVPTTGDPNLLPLLEQKGVEVRAQPMQPPWWQLALEGLLNLLPVLLLLYFSV